MMKEERREMKLTKGVSDVPVLPQHPQTLTEAQGAFAVLVELAEERLKGEGHEATLRAEGVSLLGVGADGSRRKLTSLSYTPESEPCLAR